MISEQVHISPRVGKCLLEGRSHERLGCILRNVYPGTDKITPSRRKQDIFYHNPAIFLII